LFLEYLALLGERLHLLALIGNKAKVVNSVPILAATLVAAHNYLSGHQKLSECLSLPFRLQDR
jgi:hypothetical protein